MDANVELRERAEDLRHRAVASVDAVVQKAKDLELPEPPDVLGQYREKLVENKYKVLVMGEAKRGKSTFINALVGRGILPTDVDIATAQVFQVTRSETEAYRLRFEDGSCQSIEAADLPRYGSQVVMDADGPPRLDQIIRWIEVDVPAAFIPDGISILDTPGLGALYAAHARITQRFVPQADAVIFALDSTQPVGQSELDAIEKLLEVTRNVFFIQTKIDLFRHEDWEAIQHRSEEILRQSFGDRLPDSRVWPISSANLMKAGATGEEAYLLVSRHKELAAALHVFLLRVAGWARTADAVALAGGYHSGSAQVLANRLTALSEESKQKREDLQQAMQERKTQFEAQWGPNSRQCRELLAQIHRIAAIGQQQMRQALQPGGKLESEMQGRIEKVSKVEEATALGESMGEEIMSSAVRLWREVCEQAVAQASAALQPLAVSVEELSHADYATPGIPSADPTAATLARDGLWAKLTPTYRGFGVGAAVGSIGGGLAAAGLTAIGITLAPWFVPAVIIGAGVWGLWKGWEDSGERELSRVRNQLARNLSKVMQQVRSYFLEVDISTGRTALVEEHFSTFEAQVKEAVTGAARRASEQTEEELKRLTESARLDDDQRKEQARKTQDQGREWAKLGGELKDLAAQLSSLDAALKPATAGEA